MREQTIEMLIKMKFTAMAKQYREINTNDSYTNLTFDEKISLLVEAEFYSRRNNKIKRLIKQAYFNDRNASLENIEYHTSRKLDKDYIQELSTNQYIKNHKNIILSGATGTGKTFLANALGIHACNSQYKERYYRLTELLSDIEISKIQGTYRKFLKQLLRYDVLILDDFLLVSTTESEQRDIMEMIECRTNEKSTVFCTQFKFDDWHHKLGSGAIADAVLDRVIPSSYKIHIEGDSMRLKNSIVL